MGKAAPCLLLLVCHWPESGEHATATPPDWRATIIGGGRPRPWSSLDCTRNAWRRNVGTCDCALQPPHARLQQLLHGAGGTPDLQQQHDSMSSHDCRYPAGFSNAAQAAVTLMMVFILLSQPTPLQAAEQLDRTRPANAPVNPLN